MVIIFFQFYYKIDTVQLNWLHLYSEKARQTLTFHCLNTTPYGAKLNTFLGDEMDTTFGKHKVSTRITVQDECTVCILKKHFIARTVRNNTR